MAFGAKRVQRLALGAFVVAAVVGSCAVIFRPVDQSLLARASHFDGVARAAERHIVNEHSVLLYGDGESQSLNSAWSLQDLRTGSLSDCRVVNQVFQQFPGTSVVQTQLSPDGSRLLFWPGNLSAIGAGIVSLDGSEHSLVRSVAPSTPLPHWSTDNRHWIEFPMHEYAGPIPIRIHDTVSRPAGNLDILSIPIDLRMRGAVLTMISDSLVVGAAFEPAASFARTVAAYAHSTGIPSRQFVVRMPDGWNVAGANFSPTGDRVVWTLVASGRSSLGVRMRRLMTYLHTRASPTLSLWVSRLDGSSMHEIGYVSHEFELGYTDATFEDLRWIPARNTLCFLHGSSLYEVPAY